MKNFSFFCTLQIVFLFFRFQCYSQPFQKLYGTNTSNEDIGDVLMLPGGDLIITGSTNNTDLGDTDIFVCRVSPLGDIIWQRSYGGRGNDIGTSTILSSNGNIIIAGTSNSISGADRDIVLIEINLNGRLVWSRAYGFVSTDEVLNNIKLTATGLVICGTIAERNSLSPKAFLLEVSFDGDRINWQNILTVSNGYGIIPSSIIPSSNGYVMVGGVYNPQTGYDQVVWRINRSGGLINNIVYGDSNNENAQDVIELPNNDIVVMGNFRTLSGTGLELSLSSININNTFNWIRTYGDRGRRDDRAFGFIQTINGGYAISGYTNGLGAGETDVMFVLIDEWGDMVSSSVFGDFGKENSEVLLQDNDGSFIIGGVSNSNTTSTNDIFLIRTDDRGNASNRCATYNVLQNSVNLKTRSESFIESREFFSMVNVIPIIKDLNFSENDFSCSTLPLQLVSLSCVKIEKGNKLTWITGFEEGFSHFELERMKTGNNWEYVSTIKGRQMPSEYTYIDYPDQSSLYYYRLKQFDNDGSFVYSKTIVVEFNSEDNILCYPVPSSDHIYVSSELFQTECNIQVKDAIGNLVLERRFVPNGFGDNDVRINIERIPTGVYNLSVISNQQIQSCKMIKQ